MSKLDGLQAGADTEAAPNVYTGWGADRLRFADEAEPLLRRILGVLGYEKTDELTTADLVAVIGAWCGLVQLTSADPTSPTAELWRAMYPAAFQASPMSDARTRRGEAREEADAAALVFARRFPPRFEPVDRQTLEDLAAMRAELDRTTEAAAIAMRLADACDDRYNMLRDGLCLALGVPPDGGVDLLALARGRSNEADGLRAVVDAVEERADKAERELAELRALVASSVTQVSLPKPDCVKPGQQWAFTVESVDRDGDVWLMGCDRFLYGDTFLENAVYVGPAPTVES